MVEAIILTTLPIIAAAVAVYSSCIVAGRDDDRNNRN